MPDDTLVDWIWDNEGKKVDTDVSLGNFEIACKLGKKRCPLESVCCWQCYVAKPRRTD